jgi:hypothetical protein
MRRVVGCSVILAISGGQPLWAQTNTWNKIRYNGGTVQAKVDPYDWNAVLTVKPDAITLVFGRRQTLRILPAQVTALSYGQEAHRRVAEMVAMGIMVTPFALFGILHKSKDHTVAIQFRGEDGKAAGVLLEVHKDSYKAVLQALKAATGKPVENEP